MIPIVIALIVAAIFLTGFYIGTSSMRNFEDTELLDALDYHQFDLDRWNGKNGEAGWRTYHPEKNHSYAQVTHASVRDAIREFLKNHTNE